MGFFVIITHNLVVNYRLSCHEMKVLLGILYTVVVSFVLFINWAVKVLGL